jgi:hypothetical protein
MARDEYRNRCCLVRRALFLFVRLLLVSLLLGSASTAAWAPAAVSSSGYPGVVLTRVAGVPVFTTTVARQVPSRVCPRRAATLTPHLIAASLTALRAAMPSYYRNAKRPGSPSIDARGATGRAESAVRARAGLSLRAFCGSETWARSIFVAIRLPRVHFSSSLASPSFLVARTPLGWVIWAEVH